VFLLDARRRRVPDIASRFRDDEQIKDPGAVFERASTGAWGVSGSRELPVASHTDRQGATAMEG
jgi:hypothetical protein